MAEPLSKRQIRNIMRAEHKSAGITKINPGLYRALNQYLQRLQDAYLEAHAQNKTQKALTLTKEIRDTERDISTIYELRERKILLMAQDIVRGGAPSLKYLFPEEKLLLLRLSSILLETRRDIRIDFHHHVDKYLRTIAREYDLERKLFAPFHPTAPFCEDMVEPQEQPAKASPASPSSQAITDKAHSDPMGPASGEGDKVAVGDASVGSPRGETTQKADDSAPVPDSGKSEGMSSGTPAAEEFERVTDDEVAGTGDTDQGEIDTGQGEEDGLDEEDEAKGQDFLRNYTVAGTLESIPQFRASDLHDYRFEPGEIITIPTKMAELLERQKKLFIIKMK